MLFHKISIPSPLAEGIGISWGGGGVVKEIHEALLEFLEGRGGPSMGGGMYIFWNYTICPLIVRP